MRKRMSFFEYTKWVRESGLKIDSESDGIVHFADGSTAEFSSSVTHDGCSSCGYGQEISTEVIVTEPD